MRGPWSGKGRNTEGNFFQGLRGQIDPTLRRLYRGPIETTVRRLGLQTTLERTYASVMAHIVSELEKEVGPARARFLVSNPTEYSRHVSLMNEEVILRDLLCRLRPDDVFYDIGANTGIYTCLAGDVTDTGTVVAFEPEPSNVQQLRANVEHNGLEAVIREEALADESGSTTLDVVAGESGAGSHTLRREQTGQTDRQIEVQVRRGDDLVDSGTLPVPTVVKLDVEGAELDVLKGLRSTLARDSCRLVYCEVHPERMEAFDATPKQLYATLENAGFEVSTIEERWEQYFIRAEKR